MDQEKNCRLKKPFKVSPIAKIVQYTQSLCSHSWALSHDSSQYPFMSNALALALPVTKDLPDGKYCIAGGVMRSLFYDEIPTDVDLFILGGSHEVFTVTAAFYRTAHKHRTYEVRSEDSLALGTSVKKHIEITDIPVNVPVLEETVQYNIQILGSWYITEEGVELSFSSAEDLLSHFDLISACGGIEFTILQGNIVSSHEVVHPQFLYALANKFLMVNDIGSDCSKHMTLNRLYKYIVNYGFTIPNENELMAINTLLGIQHTGIEYA